MGVGAAHGRRALVATAKDAVERANECIVGLADLQEKHNYLANQVADDIAGHTKRMDGLGAWCAKTEKAEKQNTIVACNQMARLEDRVYQIERRRDAFLNMTFRQRLRWLLTGYWVRPVLESEEISAGDTLTERAHATLADAHRAMGEAIPHTSLGPRVLP